MREKHQVAIAAGCFFCAPARDDDRRITGVGLVTAGLGCSKKFLIFCETVNF